MTAEPTTSTTVSDLSQRAGASRAKVERCRTDVALAEKEYDESRTEGRGDRLDALRAKLARLERDAERDAADLAAAERAAQRARLNEIRHAVRGAAVDAALAPELAQLAAVAAKQIAPLVVALESRLAELQQLAREGDRLASALDAGSVSFPMGGQAVGAAQRAVTSALNDAGHRNLDLSPWVARTTVGVRPRAVVVEVADDDAAE